MLAKHPNRLLRSKFSAVLFGLAAVLLVTDDSSADHRSASDDLFVASVHSDEVLRYDQQGVFAGAFAEEESGLAAPKGVTFGRGGDLYVTSSEPGTNDVWQFNGSDGMFERSLEGDAANPSGIAFGPRGNMYIASSATNEVLRRSASDDFSSEQVFADGGGLDAPKGLAFGPEGNLYVVSGQGDEVLRYDGGDGSFDQTIVHEDDLDSPTYLAFGPQNDLYVSSGGAGEVLQYQHEDGSFEFQQVFASTGLNSPTGLAFDAGGDLFVGNQFTDEVLRYTAGGSFDESFTVDGTLNGPKGVAFVPEPSSAALLGIGGFLIFKWRRLQLFG